MYHQQKNDNDVTETASGLDRKTREETGMGY